MLMSNHQVIFFDIFRNQGKIYCCLGVIDIEGKEGKVVEYANITDKIDYASFSLASDRMGTVYIVGGQRSDGSEVDQILKLTVTDALQTQDHDTQMKVVGTLKNPIKNPLVALAQNEKTLIVMDAGNLQVVQAFDTSTFQRTDLTTKI